MGAQSGNDQKAAPGRQNNCDFGINRSRLGWLRVRFEGGPSYPKMVATLKEMVNRYGSLVLRGERLSGSEWLRRIGQNGGKITEDQRRAIQTLMESNNA